LTGIVYIKIISWKTLTAYIILGRIKHVCIAVFILIIVVDTNKFAFDRNTNNLNIRRGWSASIGLSARLALSSFTIRGFYYSKLHAILPPAKETGICELSIVKLTVCYCCAALS
jgi:hypothetical protein